MIKFTRVAGEGFGSVVKYTQFDLDRKGLQLIVAPNGSGKTTIFNMVFWALFGQSLKFKNVTSWDEVQGDEFRGTLVRVEFNDGKNNYQVVRCKDYKGKIEKHKGGNRLLLYINGEHQTNVKDKTPTQEAILSILGYSADLFKSSIIFGQKLKRLVQESGPQKKKVFEEAFDAGFLKSARDKAAKHFKQLMVEYADVTKKYEGYKDAIADNKENLLELKTQRDKFEAQKQKNVNELNNKLEAIQKEFSLLKPNTKASFQLELAQKQKEFAALASSDREVDALEKDELRESNRLNGLESRLGVKANEVTALINKRKNLPRKCPRCNQPLDKKEIRKEENRLSSEYEKIKKEKKELELEIKEQEQVVRAILDKLDSKKDDKKKIIDLERKIRGLEQQIKSQEGFERKKKENEIKADLIRKQLAQIKKEKIAIDLKPLQRKLKNLRAEKKKLKPHYLSIRKQVKDLKWAMDDVLGNKGLKAYIFDTMLGQLNSRLQYYEQFIGYRVEFQVDMDSANKEIFTLCYKGKYYHYYEELSGAQQQLCDVATAFALHDMMTAGKPINILIFDEVFESLDERNIDIINELIASKAQDKCVYLITHLKAMQVGFENVITLKLSSKGHTLIKELAA